LPVQDAQLNAASPILRLTRSGETAWGPLPGGDWTIFQANHSTYEPLAWAHRDSLDYPANKSPLATVIQVSPFTFARSTFRSRSPSRTSRTTAELMRRLARPRASLLDDGKRLNHFAPRGIVNEEMVKFHDVPRKTKNHVVFGIFELAVGA